MRSACAFFLGLLLLIVAGMGCGRTAPDTSEVAVTPLPDSPDTLLRVHWMGRRELSVNGSAYYFMGLWDMPSSQHLQHDVLVKLARTPWQIYGQQPAEGAPEAFFRPVLNDIVRAETFLEIRQAPGGSIEAILAARVNDQQAGSWFTNLAATAQLATGLAPQSSVQDPRSWVIRTPRSPGLIELRRVGRWTLLGLAQTDNALLAEVAARIQKESRPAPPLKLQWLVGQVDLPRFSKAIGLTEPGLESLPRMSFEITGDGARVLSTARLHFSEPLQIDPEPWTVPVDLIHEPLTSFTAVRGVEEWLPSFSLWKELQLGEAPDQVFFWARQAGSYQSYLAAPVSDAGARVQSLSDRLMNQGNPWLEKHGYVPFERWPDGNGVAWGDQAGFRPFLRAAKQVQNSFVFAGLVRETNGAAPITMQSGFLQPLQTLTNLVYYDWEQTPARVEPWLFITQNARVVSRHPQLPMDATASVWLGNIIPRLDASETVVTQTGPNELTFSRKSSLGFTAPELHLLADWFESPLFPRGLHSLLVSLPPQPQPSGQQ